jgi:hypothetical protein
MTFATIFLIGNRSFCLNLTRVLPMSVIVAKVMSLLYRGGDPGAANVACQ